MFSCPSYLIAIDLSWYFSKSSFSSINPLLVPLIFWRYIYSKLVRVGAIFLVSPFLCRYKRLCVSNQCFFSIINFPQNYTIEKFVLLSFTHEECIQLRDADAKEQWNLINLYSIHYCSTSEVLMLTCSWTLHQYAILHKNHRIRVFIVHDTVPRSSLWPLFRKPRPLVFSVKCISCDSGVFVWTLRPPAIVVVLRLGFCVIAYVTLYRSSL